MRPTKYPPGERIIRLCKKSTVAKHLLSHIHLEQIANEYFLLWHEAVSDTEKDQVRAEYEKQVKLAFVVPLGVHAGEAAAIHVLSDNPMLSIGYLALAAVVWNLIRRLL